MSKNLPNLQLIVQEKDTLVAFTGASTSSIVEENSSVPLPLSKTPWSNPVRSDQECGSLAIAPCYSPDGELLCTVSSTEPKATITNTLTNALVQEISCSEISSVEFSPLGTYLITWSRFNVTGSSNIPAGTGNLRVWNVKTGELVTHYSQKSQKKNVIQWSSNEHLCMKKVSNEIHILDGHNISAGIKNKIHCKNVAEYSLAYGTVPSTFAYCDVACFASSVSGNPAQLSLHRIKHSSPSDVTNNNSWFTAGSVTVEGPIVSRSAMFNANEATILWNSPINSVALIYTHSDVDSSGASYYGATGAYLLGSPVPPPAGSSPVPHRITKDLAAQVSLTKAGPIYDLSWSPTGLHFVLVGGTMPSNATLYSMQGEPVYEFGSSHRNTICWSPHGRFFCIAGLGNLQGEIDFYEINVDNKNKIKKLGSASAHCTVQYGYSPDSRYFMTSILSPRMNVDNGVSIYKYNGTPVFSYDCDKSTKKTNGLAYSCMWRPSKAGIFPSRCRSPTVQGENAVPKTVTAAEPYRPPGSTGRVAELMKATKSSTTSGKVVSSAPVTKYKPPARTIPGMPVGASSVTTKPAIKPKPPKPESKPKAPAATPTPPKPPVADVAESKEKKIKNLNKKLRQIVELEAKLATGTQLNSEQQSKIASKASVEAEIASLSIQQ